MGTANWALGKGFFNTDRTATLKILKASLLCIKLFDKGMHLSYLNLINLTLFF